MSCNDEQLKFSVFIINQISQAIKKPTAIWGTITFIFFLCSKQIKKMRCFADDLQDVLDFCFVIENTDLAE